jgi:hypothetical protein
MAPVVGSGVGGLSLLIVGSAITPTTLVGVEPLAGTIVLVVLVVVGVASGPQAASRSVPITRNDAMPVNLLLPVLFRIDITNRSSLENREVVEGAGPNALLVPGSYCP